jgi:protein-S-isoprenylcysteine O-methyltransferase Ste14
MAAGWMVFALVYLDRVSTGGRLVDLGLFLFVTLTAALFLLRHPARRTGTLWEGLVAFAGTFLPMFVLSPAPGAVPGVGEAIQLIGLAGMVAAMISLAGSFGITPTDRGLRTTGLYRFVRHPLYAAELCFISGYVLANPSWRNLIGLIALAAIQIVRITREERILDGYAGYAEQVRYRLVPFVW